MPDESKYRHETKLAVLRAHMAAGRWREAVKLAATFYQLGPQKLVIERAWEAYARPDFQRQLGRCPEKLKAAGIAALRERYGEAG